MSALSNFTLNELAVFVGLVLGSVGGLMAVCSKSKCDTINICWGGLKCHRVIEPLQIDPIINPPDDEV